MVELGQAARITSQGRQVTDLDLGGLPGINADELPTTAWAVWQTARERAGRDNSPVHLYEGIVGYSWTGTMSGVIHDLWSLLSRDPKDEFADTAKRAINQYLAITKNMRCLSSTPGKAVWWVRATWNAAPPAPQPPRRMKPAELKLTPAEAGETRGNGEVSTKFKCVWPGCGDVFVNKIVRSIHHFNEHKNAPEYMLEALEQLGEEWAIIPDIHAQAVGNGFPASTDVTRRTLAALAEENLIAHKVIVTDSGQQAFVYSLKKDEPAAAAPTDVEAGLVDPAQRELSADQGFGPGEAEAELGGAEDDGKPTYESYCREPECGAGPFKNADFRGRHEKAEHPDMSSRPFACKVRGCDDRFYNVMSLGIHLATGHGHLKDTLRYVQLMEQSKAEAGMGTAPKPVAKAAPKPAPAPAPTGASDPVAAVEALVAKARKVDELERENERLRRRLAQIQSALNG